MNWAYFGSRDPTPELLYELLLQHPPEVVAVDVETESLKDRSLVGLAIAVSATDAFYFPTDSRMLPYIFSYFFTWSMWGGLPHQVYHNSLFDVRVLQDAGAEAQNIEDTIIMAQLLNLPTKLSELYHWSGRQTQDMGRVLKEHKVKRVSELPIQVVAQKCCEDAMATYGLWESLKDEVNWDYYRKEMELIPILLRMSKRGIKLDQEAVSSLQAEFESMVAHRRGDAETEWGINIASNQQVGMLLANRGIVLPLTKSRKQLRVDKATLKKVDNPFARFVLAFRKANKLLTTYIRPYSKEERAYAEFYPDTVTGRLSSKSRNLQNIPPGIRNIFIPDGQLWTDFDYSQVEMRLLAHYTGDSNMANVYEEGGDIHGATADFMGIYRRKAKNVNFAMIYGATPSTIATTADVPISQAEKLLYDYFSAYPQAGAWIKQTQRLGLEMGYVTTMGGRVINLPMAEGTEAIKRKAVNYIIQGSAAEIIKEAMRRCAHLDLAAQVHDELLGEFDLKELRSLELERIFPEVYTPIDIKQGENWRDLMKVA